MEPPSKRARLLSPDESDAHSDADAASDVGRENGVTDNAEAPLRINSEYAKRFEHNKKREEFQKLQEKYGKSEQDEASESDSESESEDDEGDLATYELDDEIMATLNAIRSKDPRVYDKSVKFYTSNPNDPPKIPTKTQDKTKPLHLRDYHRQNLLNGGQDDDEEATPQLSLVDQQEKDKHDLVTQMHNARQDGDDNQSDVESDDFLVRKPEKARLEVVQEDLPEVDVSKADEDPEAFLTSLMATRAWVPTDSSRFQPFESDEDEDDDRADEFEAAYNMRFEDPEKSNEKLASYSREAAAKHSVRREEPKGRKRAREEKKSRLEDEKSERQKEKERLRNLKIEEAQDKLNKFKEAAGLKGDYVPIEEWSSFLDAGWDSDKWDAEMENRFGDGYYAEQEDQEEDDDEEEQEEQEGMRGGRTKKAKKPEWENDIDIADIVPEFEEEENARKFTLSDEEVEVDDAETLEIGDNNIVYGHGGKKNTSRGQNRPEQKRQARKERRRLEELVDQSIALNPAAATTAKAAAGLFRYRDVSPTSFGLSAEDILMAEDRQLNKFAGLKTLATYRDPLKKRKDKKRLSKKHHLRQWRNDTFGNADGSKTSLQDFLQQRTGSNRGNERTEDQADGKPMTKGAKHKRKQKKQSPKEGKSAVST